MTTNQTIDGVPRELLESIAAYVADSPNAIMRLRATQARALLDADKVNNRKMGLMQFVEAHPIKPAAQPQGGPSREALNELWYERHLGHPADFAEEVLERWGKSKPQAEPVAKYKTYTTWPAESLAGMAARQLKDEKRWIEIRDANALEFPDMGPHDYYPVGSPIRIPAVQPAPIALAYMTYAQAEELSDHPMTYKNAYDAGLEAGLTAQLQGDQRGRPHEHR